MTELAAFRVYASTPKSVEYLQNATLKNEVHIVLAFARDYDDAGKNQVGKFVPYFDPSFSPEAIQAIRDKSKSTTIKFFLSIGGRNAKYPFQIPPGRRNEWVKNAVASLEGIVNDYGFDGIDIYYEHVRSRTDFSTTMREVIGSLKDTDNITGASLTVSAPLSGLYNNLYKAGPAYFDHVVYQSHSVTSPISTSDDLVQVIDGLTNYHKTKIFAGHSTLPGDWKNVPLPIFLGAVPKILQKGIVSISEWTVTDYDPEL